MANFIRTPRSLLALAPFVLTPFIFAPALRAGASVHRAVVTRVPPVYPELAKRMHVGGKVVLLVTVQADGSVASTKVESGHALLTAAAEDAVKRWHFAPGTESSETEIEVNFSLDGGQ